MPEPYYDDGQCVIYHGDCRTIDVWDSPTVFITDPPYGTGHYDTDVAVVDAAMLVRFCERPTAIFGYPELLIGLCVKAGLVPDEWITWWPTNAAVKGFNLNGLWKEAECVAVFGEHHLGDLRTAKNESSRRLAVSGNALAVRGTGKLAMHGSEDERRLGDVWRDASPGVGFLSHLRQHPNEKPVSVLLRLIQGLTSPGETVLDPFMGSGTTLRAAKDLGRRAIGIEVNKKYCEIAARRLAQGVLPFDLTEPPDA